MPSSSRLSPPKRSIVRCAIYTRKSTEEGLDQEFNSLDAQREACAAYIASQRHEGWTMLPDYYDDGGFSGGNMERPALRQLLADVEAGKVDVIVVYKVDRLTRALSDFAKIVEILDANGASFVSITQSFNTTTSMGRLTLNVLLSFAQFEREVISERVRDKIAASKRKGMWMGGMVPLGYDVIDRKLVVNEAEAETVRHIMRRYLALGSVVELAQELERDGVRTKIQNRENGCRRGGGAFGRGALHHLLKNRLYRGEIAFQGEVYVGEHKSIVPLDVWEAVQAQLAANGAARSSGANAREPSLLAGMIHDADGRRLKPAHAVKGSVRYRYYIGTPGSARQGEPVIRLAAGDVESLIIEGLLNVLDDETGLCERLQGRSATQTDTMIASARILRRAVPTMIIVEQRRLLQAIRLEVVARTDRVEASICGRALCSELGVETAGEGSDRLALGLPAIAFRRGHEKRVIVPAADGTPVKRDARLIELILKAQQARQQLLEGNSNQDSGSPKYSERHLVRMARLAFLAPDIVEAILEGRQPRTLTARQLLRTSEVPFAWRDQRRAFGFA